MIGKVLGVGHNFARLARIPIRLCRFGLTFIFDKTKLNQGDHARYLVLPFGDSLLRMRKGSSADFMGSLFRIIRRLRWQDARVAPLSYKDALRIAILSLGASLGEAFNAGIEYLSTTIDAMHVRTQGTSTFDRAFCIGLGYFYWLIGLAIQSYLTNLYVRWNMRALKSFVDQQLVVLKVLAFILLELVIFPLGCGLLTDFSLHPLWRDTTITSRLLMIQSRPLSVSFTLWSSGTLYMFALAQFVSQTRSIVRPGVLCFIRDAGDPNFHPIKDILDRRSLEQLRKIGISGIIYSSILLLTLGACTRLIALTTKDVLPLTWQAHRSLTSSGIELCSIAILMPIAIRSWFPSHLVRRSTRRWWKFMAHQLRITAFLLGGRAPDEELARPWPTWSALWGYGVNTNEARPSGGYARVPADDQAIMTSPLVIRTNVKGVAIDERGAEAIRAQEEAIKKMTKKPHYAVVFMPPHFRVRIILLVVSLWLTICAILLLGFLPSLIVGRSTLTILGFRTGTEPVHDGYAWFVGCAVIGSSHTLGAKAQRMYLKLRTSSNAVRRFGKHANRFAQRTAFVIAFGLITSTMLGLCVESYLNGLTRALVGDARMPSLSLLHVWTMGLMEQQLLFEIVRELYGRNQRPNFETETFATSLRSVYALLELQNGGWRRPKAMILFKKAFLPSVSLYLAVLALPLLALRLLRAAIGDVEQTQVARSVQVSSVYLVCVLYIFSGSIVRTVARRMDSWTDVIKDEHFLISTELKDYDSAEAIDDQAAAEGRENAVQDARLNAEGPIPDVLLNAGGA
jgi:E3 ubiquitin-protein ligase DOA10